ncbi:MAG: hypothetical protein ACI841_000799 [Planctomycetota bacterium]|jgi:hypothetical protein
MLKRSLIVSAWILVCASSGCGGPWETQEQQIPTTEAPSDVATPEPALTEIAVERDLLAPWDEVTLAEARLPAELHAAFLQPARLRIEVVADGSVAPAHIYVLPQIEDEAVYDRVVQLLGHEKNFWYGDEGKYSYSSRPTDEAGVLEVRVPSGLQLKVQASAQDRVAGNLTLNVSQVSAGSTQSVQLELPTRPNLDYWGRLLANGMPVADAQLTGRAWLAVAQVSANTDADGYFHVRVRDWVRPQLFVDCEEGARTLVHVLEGYETRESACVLQLPISANLELLDTATDAASAVPMLNGKVQELPYPIQYHLGWATEDWQIEGESIAGGWRWRGLPAGVELTLGPAKDGDYFELEPGENRYRRRAQGWVREP